MNKLIPHNRMLFDNFEEKELIKVLRSGNWAGGSSLKNLEDEFSSLTSMKYSIGVNSGSSALRLALKAIGIKRGDKVAFPAYCCVAIPNAILSCGAIPLPIDIEYISLNISHNELEKHDSFSAIITINTFGYPSNINGLRNFNVPIIEDCSHGFYKNDMGKNADITILSLYATKLITAGQGGMIITNNENYYNYLKDITNYVDKSSSAERTRETISAFNSVIGLCSLKRLSKNIKIRNDIANLYNNSLKINNTSAKRIWYRFVLAFKDNEKIINDFNKEGIVVVKPIDKWGIIKNKKANWAYDNLISIPLYPSLLNDEKIHIINKLSKSINKYLINYE